MSWYQYNQSEHEPTTAVPVRQQLTILALLLLLLFGSGLIPAAISWLTPERDTKTITDGRTTTPREIDTTASTLTELEGNIAIEGDAAFVWDVDKQRMLYSKNPDEQLPLASLTKLMTALVAHEILDLDESVAITSEAVNQDGANGFRPGEFFALENLSDLMLINSSNDGAFAVAAAAGAVLNEADPASSFVAAMNIKAEELGLTQTYFRNPTGLDISTTEAGAYGSARDIAFLVEYILRNRPFILERSTEPQTVLYNEAGVYHRVTNTNALIGDIPGLIGSKTGYTDLAGGNLAIAFLADLNRPVVVVVLGSSRQGRFNDVATLSEAVRASL